MNQLALAIHALDSDQAENYDLFLEHLEKEAVLVVRNFKQTINEDFDGYFMDDIGPLQWFIPPPQIFNR